MSGLADPPTKVTFAPTVTTHAPGKTRNLPVLSSSVNGSNQSSGDPMDVTPSTGAAAPSNSDSANSNANAPNGSTDANNSNTSGNNNNNNNNNNTSNNSNGPNQAIGAAAAAQQPKVVQTAFIHKLYNMLEDPSIQHLISWSSTNDSFVMSPTSEFSKVLAQYFKHTNISSFVRQLNMYGFHKGIANRMRFRFHTNPSGANVGFIQ
jgi:hypothetical protein